ncbi:hypothetical protein Poly51_49460 [Rubripirellula tenax]|uniref:Uncharacterized protein n=1 Tax=Rubripirellula tenax TaxID=2528015 RepID=A0A5C6EE84_9BACT|nr:hypothetical protein Poly51_49460 [Rubripirellula tenax]
MHRSRACKVSQMERQLSRPADRRRYRTEMKTLALLLTLFACIASNAMAEPLRIATYNLNWGNRRGDVPTGANPRSPWLFGNGPSHWYNLS